jgi:Ca-activated chloride channel family protein
VLSKLDESTLQAIAQATGGSYSRLSSDSLDQLYNSVIARLPREERKSELQEIRIERFQWALAAALLFLVFDILIRRRRSAAIHTSLIALLVFGFHPNELQAQMDLAMEDTGPPPADAPQMANARISYNAAYQALTEGDFTDAVHGYETALAQTDDLALQGKALYNLAHATYQQGRKTYESGDPQTALNQVKKAEALFQSAQEIATSDTSIQADIEQVSQVREAIEKLIEQQEPEDQQQEPPEGSEENQDPSDEGEDSENSQEGEQSESGEQDEESSKDDQIQEGESGEGSGEQSKQEQSKQEQEGSEGDPSDESGDPQNQESTDEGDESESAQSADQESTQDPVEDIPQAQSGEDVEEPDDEGGQQVGTEPTESNSDEDGQAGSMGGEAIEGMTEAEAAALLDSLRGKETLLPFNDQGRGGRPSNTRDW